ncbi:MAG: S41 family peptidase [Clostridia bacterium]|nr:S41 family peptidase [Clostridia bacterium]
MKKHTVRISTALMLMLLAVVCTFNITYFTATEYYNHRLDELEELETRYSKLKTVADIVEKHFVAEYDEKDAIETALAGYIAGLGDVWSAYYTAEQTASIEEDESNQYVGIGVTYSLSAENAYEITAVSAGGPADQAGILPGDRLVSAAGVDVSTLSSSDDLASLVKGEIGTVVTIVVERDGQQLSFEITRNLIVTYSVTSRMLENNVGYIAIADFDSKVDDEFHTHLDALVEQGAKGFVLDVRNNPGGYLNVMVDMLDLLLPSGIVITTVDKAGNEMPLTSDNYMLDMPLVVLTNEYSVSAAEFFAAALQEYDVATVIGTKTSGKGYSQQTFKLNDGSSVHISTTRYYTPKGKSLAETGVTPDVLVELSMEDLSNLLSGKLADKDDEQLQSALQNIGSQIAALPSEQPAETTEQPAETTGDSGTTAAPAE